MEVGFIGLGNMGSARSDADSYESGRRLYQRGQIRNLEMMRFVEGFGHFGSPFFTHVVKGE